MSTINYTYNVIVDRFRQFAAGHFQLRRFTHGEISQADLEKEAEWPWLHVKPRAINYSPGTRSFQFEIFISDLPRDKEDKTGYQAESITDCSLIFQDLINEIYLGNMFGSDVVLTRPVNSEPFVEQYTHTLTGVTGTIELQLDYDWSACSIPASWNYNTPTDSGSDGWGALQFIESLDQNGAFVSLLNDEETPGNSYYYGTNSSGVKGWYAIVDNVGLTCETLPDCATIISIVDDIAALQSDKVDKIAGKGLSTEDYTTAEKSKLAGIQAGAEVNVNADWNATSGDAQILNKPTIPSIAGLVPDTRTITINGTTQDLSADRTFSVGTFNLPSLTSGSVLFSNGTTIAQDNAQFFWDDTNNRLGVGTASPTAILHLVGQDSSVSVFTQSYYVNTQGNAPGFTLQRARGTIASPSSLLSDDVIAGFFASGYHSGGAFGANTTAFRFVASQNFTSTAQGTRIEFFTTPNGSTTRAERLRITDAGNLLINTTTDAGFRLDVNGTARIVNKLSVGTPTAPSAITEITSTTQGFLPPRMTTTQRDAITSPAVGLQIFNTTTSCVEYFDSFWGWMPVSPTNEWYGEYGFNYFNDGIQSDGVIGVGASGAGAGINGGANILGANGPGNATFITGTTATGICRIASHSSYAIGGGRVLQEYRCGHAILSTASNRYTSVLGFQDVFGSPNQVDGVFFLYDEGGVASGSTASPNWQCVTSSNSVRTFTTTSISVASQRKLRFIINDAGTEVLFYIDNVLVATHTTNIPTGNSRNANWGAMVTKSVGITSTQALLLDYISFKTKFTTPR